MPLPTDRPTAAPAKREAIVAAAARCFMEQGFTATRIAEIADGAGIGKGTVYEYFRSKEELLAEVCLAICSANERAAAAAFGMGDDFHPQLPTDRHPVAFVHRALADGLAIVLGKGPAEQRLFSELLLLRRRDPAVTEPAARELAAKYAAWAALAQGWIGQGVAAGFFRDDVDVAAVAELLIGLFDGLVWQSCWLEQDGPAVIGRRLADLVCRLLLVEPQRLEEYLA